MADDLSTQITIGADASGVEAGVGKAKRSLKDLGDSAKRSGKEAADGMSGVGTSAEKSARQIAAATRSVERELQKQIASYQAGSTASRQYQETIARFRGADLTALKPLLDQLDAAKAKAEAAAQANTKLSSSLDGLRAAAGATARVFAAVGVGLSAAELVKMADASTNIASRLSLVTNSASELAKVQRDLFQISQASRVSFVDLVGTYAQVARSTKDLGVSQNALLGVIKTISQAVTISGGSAQAAQAALTQLSQGFASGALRGEELNSILEQTPRLAQAIADGLGVGVGKLKELGEAGELTASKVLGALEKSAGTVAAEFGKMATTVEQSATVAGNSVLRLVGAFDKLSGATSFISGFITKLSQGIDFLTKDVEKLGSQGPLRDATDAVRALDYRATVLRNGMANGFYGPQFQKELDEVNAKLVVAKQRFNEVYAAMGGPNPRDQAGFTPRSVSYAKEAQRQADLRTSVGKILGSQAGIKDSYQKDLNTLYEGFQNNVFSADATKNLDAYRKAVVQLIKDSATAKPEGGAGAALSDSLNAQVQLYKNRDQAILDGRKAFNDQLDLMVKLGAKSELDALQETLDKETETWNARKANFDEELAAAAKKKNSQAEQERIQGQIRDAERDHQQAMAKLAGEARLLDQKSLDALEARISKEQGAARNSTEQLRLAKLEAQAVGLTGDALGKLRRSEVEYQADQLKKLAIWADVIDMSGALGKAYRQQAADMLAAFDTKSATQSAAMVEEYSRSVNDAGKALEFELSVMGLTERERATAIEQRRIENDLIKRRKEIEAGTVNNPGERTRQLGELEAAGIKDKANAENKVFLQEWEKTVGKYDDIFRQGFADMVNSGKEGWKSFTKSLATTFKTTVADAIYQQFVLPLVVNVVGSFMGLTGAGSAAAGQAGVLGGGGGIGGLINAGSTLYSALTNGISSSITAGFSKFAMSGVGQSLGLSNAIPGALDPSGAGGYQLTNLGSSVGTGLGMLGSGLAGYGLSSLVSGGYSVGGGNTVNILSGIASAFLGPLAGLAGGLVNRLFGRKLKDMGIEGTLGGAAGFDGQSYQFYKGGLFRSDKTTYSDLDPATERGIANSFKAIQTQVGTFATILGLNADKVATFTTQLKFSTQGLDEAGIQEAFAEALRTGSNELAQQVLGTWSQTSEEVTRVITSNAGRGMDDIGNSYETVTETISKTTYAASEFAKDGEEAIDTLQRLATSFTAVNEVSDALGYGLHDASLSVAAFASNVVEKFGGLEQFSQQMGQYLSNYYTDEEQRDALARRSSQAFRNVGIDISAEQIVDATRPQVRAFVEMVRQEFGADSTQYATAVQQANALAGIYDSLPSVLKPAVEAAKEFGQTVDELTQKFKSGMQSLKSERDGLAVDLLRAGGDEKGANALKRQQYLDSFVDEQGNKLDAARRQELATLYDLNEATRKEIDTLNERKSLQDELNALTDTAAQALARQRDALDESNRALFDNVQAIKLQQTIAAELPGVAGSYLTPQQGLTAGYDRVAADLVAEGFAGVTGKALERLSKGELAGLLTTIYNLGTTTDSTRLVLLRAAGALGTLKDQAVDMAAAETDRAFARAEAAANKTMEVYAESIAKVKEVFEAAKKGAADLFGEVDAVAKFQGQQGRDFIAGALAQVRAGGALPGGEDLSDAISAVGKDFAATQFASQAEADFQRLVVANELKGLQDASGDQLTTQEAQLKALKDQVEWARQQVEALRGVDSKLKTLPEAIADLILAYNTEEVTRKGGRPATLLGSGGASFDTTTGTGRTSSGTYFNAAAIADAAAAVLAANPGAAGVGSILDALQGQGFSMAEYNEMFNLPPGTLEAEAKALGKPIYHTGTTYVPETGFALLQKGEAVIPTAYNPWANGSMGGSDQAVIAELRAVKAELLEIRRQNDNLGYQAKRTADATNGQGEAPALVTTV